jgi:hypothetical protein
LPPRGLAGAARGAAASRTPPSLSLLLLLPLPAPS